MSQIFAIANQKGGVGKTTTSVNLSAALAAEGKRVLVIDIDPQGNTTSGFGVNKNEIENTVYELLLGECSVRECILPEVAKNVSLIASNVNLAGAEVELLGNSEKHYILRDEVDYIADDFDYIVIDCPPSLNILTLNAMTTAKKVIVPIQCEFLALEGVSQLIYTINLVKERLNPDLDIDGVVFTMFDSRTRLSAQVVENVRENMGAYNIYDTVIPRNVALAEAPSFGKPINEYDPRSTGAEAYRNLAKEVIAREGK